METATSWTYLGDWYGFEYWASPGQDVQVYRRKPCVDNYFAPDATGTPSALRWEGSLAWFERSVAGVLPV